MTYTKYIIIIIIQPKKHFLMQKVMANYYNYEIQSYC